LISGVIIVLEQLSYVAQILGAVAVVLSLIYVGRQLKLTNAMSRSAVRQAISGQFTEFMMGVAASPELAEAVAKILYDGRTRDDVTPTERVQLASCYGAILDRLYLAYEQQKDGILTPEEVDAVYRPGNVWMTTPFLASLWPRLRTSWPPDFVEWFERRYRASLGTPDTD
jgi:hypothetical protein